MTIENTTVLSRFTGNGVTTAFATGFAFFDAADVQVYFGDVLQTSGYTVTGGAGETGAVTFTTAPAAATAITLVRALPYIQTTDYTEITDFPAESHEDALDRAAMRDQQLAESVGRSFKVKVTQQNFNPAVTVTGNTVLGFNATGTAIKNYTAAELATFVSEYLNGGGGGGGGGGGSTVVVNDGTAAAPSISNDGDSNTGFYFPAENVVAATTAGVESVRFTATGIGRNVATPTRSIDIADTIISAADNGFIFRNLSDTTRNISIVRTDSAYSYNGVTGAVGQLYSSTSLSLMADSIGGNNSILFSVGGAIRAQLQWDGKFGIGTTTPATTLDVNGDVTITDKIIHSNDTDTSIRFPAVDTVTVETGGVERMRIASGGVRIPTTTGNATLELFNDQAINVLVNSSFNGVDFLSTNNNANWRSSVKGYVGGFSDQVGLDFATYSVSAQTTRMRILPSGNVGIGTLAPAEQLHITGNFRIGDAVQATPTGSAPLYAARAWVNFNGTGTVAIRASGNVSSITDNGTTDYTVNFTTGMPDANYATIISITDVASGNGFPKILTSGGGYAGTPLQYNTSGVRIGAVVGADVGIFNVAIFR